MSCSLVGIELSVFTGFPVASRIAILMLLNSLTFKSTYSSCRNSKSRMLVEGCMVLVTIFKSFTCSPPNIVLSTTSHEMIRFLGYVTNRFGS